MFKEDLYVTGISIHLKLILHTVNKIKENLKKNVLANWLSEIQPCHCELHFKKKNRKKYTQLKKCM